MTPSTHKYIKLIKKSIHKGKKTNTKDRQSSTNLIEKGVLQPNTIPYYLNNERALHFKYQPTILKAMLKQNQENTCQNLRQFTKNTTNEAVTKRQMTIN